MGRFIIWSYKEGGYITGRGGLVLYFSEKKAEAVVKKLSEIDVLIGDYETWEEAREQNYLIEDV